MSCVRTCHGLTALLASVLAAGFATLLPAGVQAARSEQVGSRSGAALYRDACATCHGADGRGTSSALLGFDTPLPDFSDCSFATREPDADWFAVTHAGGPVRAFDEMMPAFGDALSEAELTRVLAHVRSFCRESGWPSGDLKLPRALFTEKAYVEDELVLTTAVALEGPASVTNELVFEHRFGARNQLELIVPFGAKRMGGGWGEGIGDIGIGVKRVLLDSRSAGSILGAGAELFLPSGDEQDDFGRGRFMLEPFVVFGQLIPVVGFFQLHAGLELPLGGEPADREAFGRVALGRSFEQGRFGRAWTPMVELLARRALANGEEIEWDWVSELQLTLSRRQHVMACAGVRMPMNEIDRRPTELLLYLLWDWYDGGLTEGW